MTVASLVLAALAFLAALLTAAALVEVYGRVQALSAIAGISDQQRTVELKSLGDKPSLHGLPPDFDDYSGMLLFVSPRCNTCHEIARSLDGSYSELRLVITGADPGSCLEWMSTYDLDPEICTIDQGYAIADSIGVDATPLAILLDDGYMTAALTVPTAQTVLEMLGSIQEKATRRAV